MSGKNSTAKFEHQNLSAKLREAKLAQPNFSGITHASKTTISTKITLVGEGAGAQMNLGQRVGHTKVTSFINCPIDSSDKYICHGKVPSVVKGC